MLNYASNIIIIST